MDRKHSLMWIPVITFEKVENAKKILGLPDLCSRKEIRSAYLGLAKIWHPDIYRGNSSECNKRFRKIADAWNFMKYLMEHYRYSLRKDDIIRYQEPYEIQHERRFGGGLWAGEIENENRFLDDFFCPNIRITTENITFAGKLLKLLDLTTKESVQQQFYSVLKDNNNDKFILKLGNARDFLLAFLENYRFILTETAIRKDQEDPLAWHRRHFDSEPLWSGGIYDNPFYENHIAKRKDNGKFKGIC